VRPLEDRWHGMISCPEFVHCNKLLVLTPKYDTVVPSTSC